MTNTIATTTICPKDQTFEAIKWDGSDEVATRIVDWVTATDSEATATRHQFRLAERTVFGAVLAPCVPSHIEITSGGATFRVNADDWVMQRPDGHFDVVWAGDFDLFYDA